MFWLVELPCMGARGDYDEIRWPNWTALVLDHTVPIIVMTMEWTHNSIAVEWDRLPFYLGASFVYIIILDIATFAVHTSDYGTTYASMRFYNEPWIANLVIFSVSVLQGLCFWGVKVASDWKLQVWSDLEMIEEPVK